MTPDFRLAVGLFRHPKFIKLKRKLGAEGGLAYITFLSFVTENRPDGNLGQMSAEDIAIAADWNGDESAFLAALVEVGFLDRDGEGGHVVHDWAEHNPWAAGAPARSDKAKHAADIRWGRNGHAPGTAPDAGSSSNGCGEHATGMLVASVSNAPLLSSPLLSLTQDTLSDTQGIAAEGGETPAPVADSPPKPVEGQRKRTTVTRQSQYAWLRTVPAELLDHANRFERKFYPAYPRKESPKEAWMAWKKIAPEWSVELGRQIITALEAYKACPQWQDPQMIPYPATWINDRRWEGLPPTEEKNHSGSRKIATAPPPPYHQLLK